MDSYILVDSGQSQDLRLASVYWRPATVVLGMEPEPCEASNTPSAQDEEPEELSTTRRAIRHRLREDTAYGTARSLISFLAGLTIFGLVVVAIMSVEFLPGQVMNEVVIVLGVEVLATIVGAAFLHAMLDLADANLRRQF